MSIIAFMGADGAGKTTVMNAVLPILEMRYRLRFKVQHLKPDFLPILGKLRGVKHERGYVCVNPHGSRPSGFMGSLFRLTYLVCDYVFGYWFKVRPTLRSKEVSCWVFDRYAYDILIDPLRFRIKLPRWIIRLYLKMVPRPNIVLCLGGDPEKIFARKPETSLTEVKRQMIELENLSAGLTNVRMIDTTVSIEDTVEAAMKALEDLWRGQ